MVRSNLTTKFNIGVVNKFQKQYRNENEDCKNQNIGRYITIGVIDRKSVPDLEDCILLIKLGNNNCDDKQAEDILQRWLDDDANKERGITGAFCELCKDYCLDIPVDTNHRQVCEQLEDFINKRLESQNKINEIMNKFGELISDMESKLNKETDKGTEEVSTQ